MRKMGQGFMNPQYERSFADLASAYLRDKAPVLMEDLRGFQVIERADNGTRSVGVMGFRIGQDWYYAPMFFLNGELKGGLLYGAKSDLFVPLRENWVHYLLGRKPVELGHGSARHLRELGLKTPDMRFWSMSPISRWNHNVQADYGADRPDELSADLQAGQRFDLTPCTRWWTISPNDPYYRKSAARTDLASLLARPEAAGMRRTLVATLLKSATFRRAWQRYYRDSDLLKSASGEPCRLSVPSDDLLRRHDLTPHRFLDVARRLQTQMPKSAEERVVMAMLIRGGVERPSGIRSALPILRRHWFDRPEPKRAAQDLVRVIRQSEIGQDPDQYSDQERQEAARRGWAVRDLRPAAKQASAYWPDFGSTTTSSAHTTAVCHVWLSSGDTRRVLTVVQPVPVGRAQDDRHDIMLVDLESSPPGYRRMPNQVFVDEQRTEDWSAWWSGLPSLTSMEPGRAYMAVGRRGSVSAPFRVLPHEGHEPESRPEALDSGQRFWSVEPEWVPGLRYEPMDRSEHRTGIVMSDLTADMRPVGSYLFCPADTRVLAVDPDAPDRLNCATLSDLSLFVMGRSDTAPLRVWGGGQSWALSFKSGHRTGLDGAHAMDVLMREVGLGQETAQHLLDESRSRGHVEVWVKAGQSFDPSVADPQPVYDPAWGASVDQPVEQYQTIDTAALDGGLPEDDIRLADRAAQTGQKDVFDVATLAGLTKAHDVDSLVDQYTADLVVGMDRLGRMLFLYYWHHERFRDRYGDDEMRELEDNLRSTFEGLGDVVLFLKRRQIEADPSIEGADVELQG